MERDTIWRTPPGFDGLCEVSNDGDLRVFVKRGIPRPEGVMLKSSIKNDYRGTTINGVAVRIYKLIANTFIPNPLGLSEVNHINGLKHDDRVENLEWCTHSHNMRHARNDIPRRMIESGEVSRETINEIIKQHLAGVKQLWIAWELKISVIFVNFVIRTNKNNAPLLHSWIKQ